MFYDKKVRYLDYCRGGQRIKGGGFARTEIRGEDFKLELNLKGIPSAEGLSADVILSGSGGEAVLGRVRIENGCGVFRYQGNLRRDLPGREMDCMELSGIRVPLGEGIRVSCEWAPEGKKQGPQADGRRGTGEKEQRPQAEKKTDFVREGSLREESERERKRAEEQGRQAEKKTDFVREGSLREESKRERKRAEEQGPQAEKKTDFVREEFLSEESERGWEVAAEREDREGKRSGEVAFEKAACERKENADRAKIAAKDSHPIKLHEDKWRQLSAIYPHLQPFHDERDYLSVGPADFVIFSAESYRAVNNSFLLHGYYNYRHLILTRLERRGETLYYVGVPGNYFDREKQVAVMFGFESFECAEEPAQDGDFGYYMMKVEL
ncbi:MAG: hypothetical protein NC541_13875 [bacterium]|nr:hypothetical protein [bacterium]